MQPTPGNEFPGYVQSSVETDETGLPPTTGGPARSAGCPRQGTILHSPRIYSRAALGGSQTRPCCTWKLSVPCQADPQSQRTSIRLTCIPFMITVESDCRFTQDRKSTRLNSSHVKISYSVVCFKKKRM